jgi:hypothetical protein
VSYRRQYYGFFNLNINGTLVYFWLYCGGLKFFEPHLLSGSVLSGQWFNFCTKNLRIDPFFFQTFGDRKRLEANVKITAFQSLQRRRQRKANNA